ncbi:VOC family protein [Mesorhizobium sp. BH1-1-4]|uniref:VOC family protein n=1 Tax=Mesorhizobium sp. BH1-1-4 TaxID=2876662 RepID=UPI0029623B66|nr:VOC family protein [Mesorhizobium sp. BH1-1-4]
MTVCSMWHASWTVESMERTLPFYTDLLGLEVIHTQIQDNEYTRKLVGIEGAILKAVLLKVPELDAGLSGHIIELMEYIQPKGVKIDTKPCNIGAAHFAFGTRDVHAMYEKMSAAGVEFVSEPVAITAGINKGGFTCYLHDPDGYTLELMQPPSWRFDQAIALTRKVGQ